ncbi:PAAR domain-containing protein [Burkholderia pseudomallei]|uniref:PAAR domain-containing protein n=1 Tax=Burkholderia pseudomallei TaxID=28450 RepID=UPI000F0793A1|nr:PAAR domain-containing protein [Burkholderia pseudomallei]CAJ3079904.1 PAAR repeat-containing protein [Burkholderia pseudomallei]VCK80305.1 PAAR repeat-containing protein [Burkholderia pseudomallei]VCK83545.1 PAAR repeat-containing protein [Burkholderia pseudomallei]VCK91540.1 PAAR repeat-containing protein [Burkholderia pseudomallei]VCK96853.1 PAAR repeat-containing protein [Burkholderia pseudomallei]
MSAFIREGDTTSHGGRVLACSTEHIIHGKAVARLGDMVSCPKCGGIYPIVDVLPRGMSMGGKHPAFEGDKTACGATLIATQSVATAQPTSGPGGHIQGGPTATHEASNQGPGPYRGRFQVLDQNTGQPIPDHPYTLRTADGHTITGRTDANGYTQWHEAESPASLHFSADSTQSTGWSEAS